MGEKEYNYEYEEEKLLRSTESDIILSNELVISKHLVNTVKYYYADDKMSKKEITFENGTVQTIYYENSEDNTVVKFSAGGKTITAHSKTDSFGRKVFDEIQLGTGFVSRQFSYLTGIETEEHKQNEKLKSSPTTQLVSQIILSGGRTILYEYDEEERITKVDDSVDGITTYTYDALGQLTSETKGGVTTKFEYDNYGNILAKGVVDETGEIAEATKITYEYNDGDWKDLLTAYNGQSITYDAQGNPTSYLGHNLTWEKGRQLKSFDNIQYTYNANGIRTSKTIGGIRHDFVLDGAKILRETWNGNSIVPLYDNEESVCGIVYNGTAYYFLKNLQGDIIAIANSFGDTVARYSYDAWGKCTIDFDSTGYIANINPYRYRGYYYDEEIGMYYLQSRYYNPIVGRFVNSDEGLYLQIVENPVEYSLYSYCYCDPTNRVDNCGNLPSWIKNLLNPIKGLFSAYLFNGLLKMQTLVTGGLGKIATIIKAISNYKHNKNLENKKPISGLINNQNDYKEWKLGYNFLDKCGCELIAVYNVMKTLGKSITLSYLALQFELSGYVMLFGFFGSAPTHLYKCFSFANISYKMSYSLNTLSNKAKYSKCAIVSSWNKPITTGLHTFMVKYENKKFVAYNGYHNKKQDKNLSNLLYSDRFIVGYWF